VAADASGDCMLAGSPAPTLGLPPAPASYGSGPTVNCSSVGNCLPIGSVGACAPGYVIADNSGNCAPAGQVAATLSTPAGAAAAGLSPSAATSIASAITAGANAAKAVVAPTSYVVPGTALTSNATLGGIPISYWAMGGAAVLFLLAVIGGKRR